MMKKLIYSIVLVMIVGAMFSCNQNALPQVAEKVIEIQDYKDKRGRANLIGEVNKAAMQEEPYAAWFTRNYDAYTPNTEMIAEIKKTIQQYEIEAFFGTWCGDSKRDVPRFYKILDEAGYDLNRLKIVAVGNEGALYKKSPDGETEGKDISNVPTFIFYNKKGEEVNRIVENKTGVSLEEDVMKIVTGQEYKNKYADF